MAFPSERRDSERIKTNNFTVECQFSTDSYPISANVINISDGGICLLRNVPIQKNDIIQVVFPFRTRKLILRAQVMRVEGREVGLKFMEDDEILADLTALFHREQKMHASETDMKEEEEKINLSRREDIEDILDLDD